MTMNMSDDIEKVMKPRINNELNLFNILNRKDSQETNLLVLTVSTSLSLSLPLWPIIIIIINYQIYPFVHYHNTPKNN